MLKKRKEHRAVGITASVCAVILFGSIINPAAKNQESAEAITDLTGETAITMTSINNAASITIDPSITGVFATTSGANDISFSVATSNYTGYALSVRSTKTTIDKDDNSFTSLASGVTAEQFSTSSNTTLNNRWGFKPNFYNSESNSRYYGISTTAVTLDRTSTANTTAKNYTISLGARADTSLPSGTYINENLILEATANIIPSSILTVNYGTGVTGVAIGGVTIANGETVKLIRGAPYQINMTYDQTLYAFDSWSVTSGTIGSSSTQSTTYTISTTDATLTANVAFIGPDIQNLSSALCTSTPRLVKDNRDNHIYTVQRLDDGNCWMMENLDLGRTGITTDLTSSNTNLATTVTAETFNSWKKTSGSGTYDAGEYISVSGTDATSGTAYGTLYNYYAASAGTISGSSNSSNAQYDICPAGWRLPTGGSSGEFQALYAEYNSNALMRASIKNSGAAFALAGGFHSAAPAVQGSIGYYWSSTRNDDTYMYDLVLYTSNVDPASRGYRGSGLAIRCVLKEPMTISKLTYMQDFNNLSAEDKTTVLASMEDSTTYNLIDNRDNKTYAVAKMKDGKVWMAENLDLGRTTLTTNLTSSNTNLSTTVTASTFNSWKKTTGSRTYDAGEYISVSGTDATSGTPYGTLYNYYAASAGTISGSTNSSNAQYDICPAGWRLPTGGSSGEFRALYNQYNSTALTRASIENSGAAFALAGDFNDAAPANQGSYGNYWSSTRNDGTNMYGLGLGTSYVSPVSGSGRRNGYAIRCVVKNPSHTLSVTYGTGVTDVTINGISVANGGTINLEESVSYSVNATLSSNYYFAGWSATSGTLGSTSARPTTYTIGSSNATLIVSATFNGTYMQNLNADACTTTASTVYDSRDMHAYTIQRLNDGSCWMMENLDLGRTTLTTNLTSSNTNLSATITASTFNSWKTTAGTDSYVDGQFITLSGTDSTSGTAYGTLYNYYTASAGTISGSSNNSNATYDICPAGWRLPTGGETGDFYRLYSSGYDYNTLRTPIISGGAQFALAGYFYAGAPTGAESSGRYWSSTPYNSTSFLGMHFYNGAVYPTMWNFHYFARNKVGASIRCILKESRTITKLKYLQTFKYFSSGEMAEVLASMANNTIYNLTDMRDNRVYAVAKLKDGRIWMAENLDLGRTTLTTDLTSANTNLATTVTAETFNSWKKDSGTATYDTGEFINVTGTDSTSGTPYGTLYNYYAASAGTISGSSNSSDASYDICPAGWRLPTGGSSGEFQALYAEYNSYALMRASIENNGAAFALAGLFGSSTPANQGSYGNYWSSTRSNVTSMYRLRLNTSNVYPAYDNGRYGGFSIRCVVK